MQYEYDTDADETNATIDGETFATMEGKVTRWRGPIPHPETDHYDTFENGLLQLDSPTERRVLLHLISGNVERVGFDSL